MQTLTPKPISRQRLYQLRKKAEGRCVICGNARSPISTNYCEHHRELVNTRQNKKYNIGKFPAKLWSKALDNFIH